MTNKMHFIDYFDRPELVAMVTIIWLEVVEVIPFLTDVKLLLQVIIGILTIAYMIMKIKRIIKINNQIDKQNGKEKSDQIDP